MSKENDKKTQFIIQNYLTMKQKLLNSFRLKAMLLVAVLCALFTGTAWGAEEVYKTALFGSSYNANNSSYTSSFDATNGTFVVTATNFNNNSNGWTNSAGNGQIKCGRKNVASVGTITTKAAIDEAITKVVVTVDAFTSGKVNSFKLYVASDASFTQNLQTITATIATGANTFTVTTPTANRYYKVEIDCASGSGNGLVTVSKVEYYYNSTVDLTNEELAWSGSSYTATIGASNTFPTLTNTQGVTVSYQSTNESAATIDSDGNISLVAAGETTIKAVFAGNSTYNAKTVSYDLTVLAAGAVAAPTFNKDNGASVELGTEVTINAPSNDCTLKYQIGDGDVVNVNTYTANVTMNTVGSVTLKAWAVKNATDSDPAQISLTVTKHPITPSFTSTSVDVVRGNNVAAPALSGNTGSGTVTYASANTDIATVDENTGEVTGVAVGNTTITATIAATATYLGNTATFTVNVTKPTHTATFYCNGSTVSSASVAEGSAITFPTAVETPSAGQIPETSNGKTFLGWFTTEYTHATDAPAYVNSANMGNADVTYYAVYANVTGSASWVEATLASMTSTDVFVFASDTYAMKNDGGTSGSPKPANITVSDGKITSSVTDAMKWKVSGNSTDGYTFLKYDDTTKWLYCNTTASSGSNDNLRVGTGARKLWIYQGSYLKTNDSNTARYLSMNGTTDFRSYVNTSNNPVTPTFYKYQGPTYSNYTTDARAEAGISFAKASVDAQLTSGYTGQALTNPNLLTVSCSSSDPTVATVNSSTGAITELLKAGSTTITASFAGNATYKPAEVSYTLNVTEKTPAGLAYAVVEVEKLTTDAAFTNALTNSHSLSVSYSSSATGVAIVDSSTGEVTIKGAGETTITASFVGDEDYEAGEASYTLTVSKATPTLSFASENATGREGEAFAGNELTNPANLSVSYSSSDTDVATVNETSGAVTIVAGGTTTITASFTGNDTYTTGSASYTLKVLATPTIPAMSDEEIAWGETFTVDDSGITGGPVSVSSDNTSIATVDGLEITPVACGEVEITVCTAEDETYKAGSITFTLTVTAPEGSEKAPAPVEAFYESFDTSNGPWNEGNFSGSGSVAFASDNTGWTTVSANAGNKCAKFGSSGTKGSAKTPSVSVDNGETYTITFKAAPWNTETTKMSVSVTGGTITGISTDDMTTQKWNDYTGTIIATSTSLTVTFTPNGNNRFFLDEVRITKPAETSTSVTTNGGYATYCYQYPLNLDGISGAKAYKVSSLDESNEKVMLTQITGTIKGGVPFILKSDADTDIEIPLADESDNVPDGNLLVGTLAPTFVEQTSGDYTNFAYSKSNGCFVKLGNDGNTVPANRAYLPINLDGGGVKALTFDFGNATGINTVQGSGFKVQDSKIYNLAGQRVDGSRFKVNGSGLKTGIYIVNGKKVLVK